MARLPLVLSLLFMAASPALAAKPAAAPAAALPFIEGDYARALAEAKAKKLPLFVEAWAPWCHTCNYMRAYVLTDPELGKQAGRFVWLSIDTENPKNAAFVAKFPITLWPTLMIIDPQRELVLVKWQGSANVTDLVGLLDDGAHALDPSHNGKADSLLAKAHATQAAGQYTVSAELYNEALEAGGPAWPAAPRVLESLVTLLQSSRLFQSCANIAISKSSSIPKAGAYANIVTTGLQCASDADPSEPWRAEAIKKLEPMAMEAVALPDLLADDRSGIYEGLVEMAEARGDQAGKHKLAEQWLAFLEGEAAKAPDPARRMVFDPHRLEASMALGDPSRALPALKQSERDQPQDYNAFAREAVALHALGKLPEALAASEKALKLVYGPRTLRVLQVHVQILKAMHRDAEAHKTLQMAVDRAHSLPASQVSPRVMHALEQQLAADSGAPNTR